MSKIRHQPEGIQSQSPTIFPKLLFVTVGEGFGQGQHWPKMEDIWVRIE